MHVDGKCGKKSIGTHLAYIYMLRFVAATATLSVKMGCSKPGKGDSVQAQLPQLVALNSLVQLGTPTTPKPLKSTVRIAFAVLCFSFDLSTPNLPFYKENVVGMEPWAIRKAYKRGRSYPPDSKKNQEHCAYQCYRPPPPPPQYMASA